MGGSKDTGTISLHHREVIEELRRHYGHDLSSHAFCSLYLWRKPLGLSLLQRRDMFTVKCTRRGKNSWFFPCGSNRAVARFLEEHGKERDFSLCYMRRQDVKLLEKYQPGRFRIRPDPGSGEYIYDIAGHMSLKGKRYANVRTQLHKVTREHKLSAEEISTENIGRALCVLSDWKIQKKNSGYAVPDMEEVEEEALHNRSLLGISGILVYVDGEPCSVVAGYPITGNTYDIFLAKEKKQIQGLSYYAKRTYFSSLPPQYAYINLEEDLGIEGLRKEKTILGPVKMNDVWEAVRRI